jgi:hypothetical protein
VPRWRAGIELFGLGSEGKLGLINVGSIEDVFGNGLVGAQAEFFEHLDLAHKIAAAVGTTTLHFVIRWKKSSAC